MSRDLFPREVAPEPGLAILLRHRDVEQCFCVTAIFVCRCLSWVNRVILAEGRRLPVFPREQTSPRPVGMSQKGR
jgi:hypothetical protein